MWLKTNMTFADHKQRFFDDDDDLIHVKKRLNLIIQPSSQDHFDS